MNICGTNVKIEGRLVRIASVEAEGFEYMEDPEGAIEYLKNAGVRADIFKFSQRLPNTEPKYNFAMDSTNVAALPIATFDQWWNKQIDGKTRNVVRRAEKKGIIVREVPFDDALVQGIWEIYNECPVRQGRRFPHYGKDVETVRKMSATFMASSIFIGAYLEDKLIGFAKLTTDHARSQAAVMHIVAMIQHRDKSPTNALIAQAVKSCESHGLPYLVYSNFAYGKKQRDTLADFKESNGFKQIDLPRYYVPLTLRGRLAFRMGMHHRWRDFIPEPLVENFRKWRLNWYNRKSQSLAKTS
jgi:hypothetical protein